jgi:hypothetical protein
MNPVAAVAVKVIAGGGAAALLSIGIASGLAQAASPSPSPNPGSSASTGSNPSTDRHADRRAIRRAVLEAEADVLGITPAQLRDDLKKGQKVADLAKDKGMTKEQFADKLLVALKPRLAQLVDEKVITQAQADHVVDRITHGHIPWWGGRHPRRK